MIYDNREWKDLVGKTIAAVTLHPNRERLVIEFTDGTTATGTTFADCCSETWIDDLTVPVDAVGAEVLRYAESEEVPQDCPSKNPPAWTDQVQVYNSSIVTSRGEIIIDYRNSSNGYYGGSLDWSIR